MLTGGTAIAAIAFVVALLTTAKTEDAGVERLWEEWKAQSAYSEDCAIHSIVELSDGH